MHVSDSIHRLVKAIWGGCLIFGVMFVLLASSLAAQKVVVLTSADVGKVVTGTHHYTQKDKSFLLTLKHRLGDQKQWQISLQKTEAFEKSPFTLKSTLPATIGPDGALQLEFDVNYSRSLQQENTISLLAVPQGETDAKNKGIAINIKLSADGALMFFNEKSKVYTKSLPTFEFLGPAEKMLEVTWNGGAAKACTIKIEESKSNSFTLIPNSPGAGPVKSGSTINLGSGGNSFFIRYDGAARKGSADVAKFTFTESGGQSIVTTMIGTYQGGNSLIAAARELLTRDNWIGGFSTAEPVIAPLVVKKQPDPVPNAIVKMDSAKGKQNGASSLKVTPTNPNTNPPIVSNPPSESVKATRPAVAINRPVASPKALAVNIAEFNDGVVSGEEGRNRLNKYFRHYGENNLVQIHTARFEKKDGLYEAHLRISKADSLKSDIDFGLHFIKARFKTATDSITVNAGDNAKMLGDSVLRLLLTPEDRDKLASADSFTVMTEFVSDYNTADGVVNADSLVYKGTTFGRVYSNNNWKFLLWGALIAAFVLLLVVGFVVSRQAITSFRYLRESRYQRERHNANSQRQRVDVETIHIDLARRDSDLIQLSFVDRGEGLDGRAEGGIEKVRSIAATVPTPRRNGFRRFFGWIFAPFGRKRDLKFKSVYYSLRIELPRGSVPQQLRLKDESGMLMLGTSLTGNVLATDHQDFKFVKRPFLYSLYLDPSEFMDYTGAMKTVSIPFRVIEEPFEGYVMTREFNLNLEIAQRF